MFPAPGELKVPETPKKIGSLQEESHGFKFPNLRGVQWRINLGILPSSSCIEDLRRTAADSRRKYASLRRRLLVDPHFTKDDGSKSPDLVMDNPLSQNPHSMWGRFFRNAELEKTLDQDLSRLYPEHGSYFQTPSCQAMLRRILLLWCLRHPEYGYRQGMHELLAPLLYVLHLDIQHLAQVRELYEDHFSDKFDGMCFQESHLAYNFTMISSPVSSKWATDNEESSPKETAATSGTLDELDPDVQTIILLSDAYGAEGELGILLSERFMEHDAYCMFDALMSGAGGVVAMVDYYSPSTPAVSLWGLPPIIEASSALYHLLSIVDSSLHSHLVELGVEPQYFALRWLRVLFGREFSLQDLLIIWDEIFASSNTRLPISTEDDLLMNNFMLLSSPRGAFIAAMAVAMLLHVRSSLFATEISTVCLQRLLNFPGNVDVKKVIEKAKSLQDVALDANMSPSPSIGLFNSGKAASMRSYSLSSTSISPRTPLNLLPESYWEEKWRVAHKEEDIKLGNPSDPLSVGTKKTRGKDKLHLARTGSAPVSVEVSGGKRTSRMSVRRRLLEDLSRALGDDEYSEKLGSDDDANAQGPISVGWEKYSCKDLSEQNGIDGSFTSMTGSVCLSGPASAIEENSVFSSSTSPCSTANDYEQDTEKSSFTSNSSSSENDDETSNLDEPCNRTILDDSPSSDSQPSEVTEESHKCETGAMVTMECRPMSSKFQWFWKFGKSNENNVEKEGNIEPQRSVNSGNQNGIKSLSDTNDCKTLGLRNSAETTDKNMMGTLKNLGQSMLENIQVIESVFQQDRGQVGSLENLSRNILGGKGPNTAMAALKELRKISNLLSEM